MKMQVKIATLLLFVFGVSLLFSQDTIPTAVTPMNNTGDLPYSTTIGTDIEHIDLSSGNLIVTIPFASVPGRKMSFDFGIRFDARFWTYHSVPSGSGVAWNPEMRNWLTTNTIGWTPTQGYLTYSQSSLQKLCAQQEPAGFRDLCNENEVAGDLWNSYIFTDRQGVKHSLPVTREIGTSDVGSYDASRYLMPTPDMDGYFAQLRIGPFPNVQAPDGTSYYPGGVSGGASQPVQHLYFEDFASESDLRGNTQTIAPGGTDSIGRTLVTQQSSANQIIYTIHDSNGTPQSYIVNLEPIAISTQFDGIPAEYSATRQTVSSIILPNLQSYSFQYDSFGDITQIVMPDGATVNYQWETTINSSIGVLRSVTQRTVVHDGRSDAWNMSYGFVNSVPETVTVTNPPDSAGIEAQTIYSYDINQHLLQIQYLASPGGKLLLQYNLTWDKSTTQLDLWPSNLLVL